LQEKQNAMITKTHFKDILTIIGLSVVLTIFITHPVHSQDSTKASGNKKVVIIAKIINDKNGKTQEFDTTVNLDHNLKPGEEQQIIKDFEKKYNDHGDVMNELEVEMRDMKLPDSAMVDSIKNLTDKVIRLHKRFGEGHFKHDFPEAFNFDYNFEMPDLEKGLPRIEEFNDENIPGRNEERRELRREGGESLNDLLGDIPMNRVKSYSIKDTKDGKKITIELKNGPWIENQRKVIIMRSPRSEGNHRQTQPQIRKRIIIKDGKQQKEEKDDDTESL
jgi:hypothetical protein